MEDQKHSADYRRQWRKVHLGIDASTLEIRAIEVMDNSVGDAPMLPYLLNQIAADEVIASVRAYGAYDTRNCHQVIAQRDAHAIIPTRQNAKPWKATCAGATARNTILRATQRLGRAIWKQWSGYHRRSLVETKMRCFKLLGERVMARHFDRQVVELHIRADILNRFTRLGNPITVAMP
jgi:Transposase DDE domain